MSKAMLKQAEQNVVNRAKAYNDTIEVLDALAHFGNRACHEYIGKKDFFDGLALMRKAVFAEQSQALRECFYFAGVGGKEAEEYSRQMFKRAFGGKYQIMDFLDKWGHMPSCWNAKEQEEFKKECQEAIEAMPD